MSSAASVEQLVVVGSSAGGIDALCTLVAVLPETFPAPLIIAQHLDSQRPSHLAEILAPRSRLPVHTMFDRERLQAGHIYVVPADRHATIAEGHLHLQHEHAGRPKPSINLLLSTAAQVYGEGLIAVILTGTGSDGTAGSLEVKKAGGTVVIQNPATASFPAMPQSLSPAIVDIVANIDDIGGILTDLLTGLLTGPAPTDPAALQRFLQQVQEHSGLDFTAYKPATIQRRLQQRMVATGSVSLASYRRFVQSHPDEYARLISSFLIKVTEFFRDRALFTILREQILPDIIRQARQHDNKLRLWSAGCATGEEAYSLALLLADLLGEELDQFTVRIFATDLDPDAIAFARRGVYPATAIATLPSELRTHFVAQEHGDYEITKRVRSLVVFGQHDLGQRAPFPRIDLILCRNVLIYFTQALQKRILQLFAYSLRDAGVLVLGKAETPSPFAEFFTPLHPTLKIYQRYGERLLMPGGPYTESTPVPAPTVRPVGHAGTVLPTRKPPAHVRSALEQLGDLVFTLPLGVVVVDRHYDIQIINGVALQLLEIHRPALGEDLLHLAEEVPTKPLRALIDATLQAQRPSPMTDHLTFPTVLGEPRTLHIMGYASQGAGVTPTVLLLITAVPTPHADPPPAPRTVPRAQGSDGPSDQDTIARLTTQVERLLTINQDLRAANHALMTTNTDLVQDQEAAIVTTEEIQAASEEVETLNEELQATNEELETLNEELQATVEELHATNDDLQARSADLRTVAHDREDQRQRSEDARAQLALILAQMGDAVLVVAPDGRPLLTNQAYVQFFGTAPVMADEHGTPLPMAATPLVRAARGETFSLTFTQLAADGTRSWFEANGQPIARDGVLQGGIAVIRDISDRSMRRLQDEFLAVASHELRSPLTAAQMALQLIQRKLPEQEAVQRQLAIALRQVQRLTMLVNDLLEVSRLQTGHVLVQLQPVDLFTVVAHAVETVQILTPQPILLTAPADPVIVHGDALRLEQVITNLLTNAVKYASASPQIAVQLRQAAGMAEVQVRDAGPGIAADHVSALFTRFYQVQTDTNHALGGLGLGLFISKELVTAHGGTITVQSEVGHGTTFTVSLPAASDGHDLAHDPRRHGGEA